MNFMMEIVHNNYSHIYFADPYSARQRGTNENTNGLIRQCFPKGTDFRNISEKEGAIVVKKLNNRPRKRLDYQTPHEVFRQALLGAFEMEFTFNLMFHNYPVTMHYG